MITNKKLRQEGWTSVENYEGVKSEQECRHKEKEEQQRANNKTSKSRKHSRTPPPRTRPAVYKAESRESAVGNSEGGDA